MTSPLGTGEAGTESSCSLFGLQDDSRASAKFLIPGSFLGCPGNAANYHCSGYFIHNQHLSLPAQLLSDLLLAIVVLLQRLLQLGGDLLEEVDLLAEVVLHLGAEVPYPCAVEMLDLCQRGARNDVAAVVELALLLWTVLHLGQSTWRRANRQGEAA